MNQSINTDSKNSKEPQQKYRLGTVSIKILGGLFRFYGRPTSPSACVMAQNIQLFGPRGGFLTTPLEHWSRRKPTDEPRWAKQQTKKLRPKPTKINSFMSGSSLESDARPTGVQLKREAKLLTVIGLNTKHADCRIIFMLYPIRL